MTTAMNAALPGLDQLRELPLPAPISFWPQTWGWMVLAVVLAAMTGWLTTRAWRWWSTDRYRREAVIELQQIEAAAAANPLAARGLPALLKRTALAAQAPGGKAASLGGDAWLAWLANNGPALPGDGAQLLTTLAYAPDAAVRALDPADVRRLFAASRRWMERHHVAA